MLDLKAWIEKVTENANLNAKSTAPNAVSCASGSIVSITSVALTQGTWLVIYGGAFASNATGMRRMHLGTNTTMGRYSPTQPATNGDQTRMNASQIYEATGATTLTLYASQNSGSALQFYGYIQAVRLGGGST